MSCHVSHHVITRCHVSRHVIISCHLSRHADHVCLHHANHLCLRVAGNFLTSARDCACRLYVCGCLCVYHLCVCHPCAMGRQDLSRAFSLSGMVWARNRIPLVQQSRCSSPPLARCEVIVWECTVLSSTVTSRSVCGGERIPSEGKSDIACAPIEGEADKVSTSIQGCFANKSRVLSLAHLRLDEHKHKAHQTRPPPESKMCKTPPSPHLSVQQ